MSMKETGGFTGFLGFLNQKSEWKPFLEMREKNPTCGHKDGGVDSALPRDKIGYLGHSEAQLEMSSLLPPAPGGCCLVLLC